MEAVRNSLFSRSRNATKSGSWPAADDIIENKKLKSTTTIKYYDETVKTNERQNPLPIDTNLPTTSVLSRLVSACCTNSTNLRSATEDDMDLYSPIVSQSLETKLDFIIPPPAIPNDYHIQIQSDRCFRMKDIDIETLYRKKPKPTGELETPAEVEAAIHARDHLINELQTSICMLQLDKKRFIQACTRIEDLYSSEIQRIYTASQKLIKRNRHKQRHKDQFMSIYFDENDENSPEKSKKEFSLLHVSDLSASDGHMEHEHELEDKNQVQVQNSTQRLEVQIKADMLLLKKHIKDATTDDLEALSRSKALLEMQLATKHEELQEVVRTFGLLQSDVVIREEKLREERRCAEQSVELANKEKMILREETSRMRIDLSRVVVERDRLKLLLESLEQTSTHATEELKQRMKVSETLLQQEREQRVSAEETAKDTDRRERETRVMLTAANEKIRLLKIQVAELGGGGGYDFNNTSTPTSNHNAISQALQLERERVVMLEQQLEEMLSRESNDKKIHREEENSRTMLMERFEREITRFRNTLSEQQKAFSIERLQWEEQAHKWDLELRMAEKKRREMHNLVQELRGNIRVFARVRPDPTQPSCIEHKPDLSTLVITTSDDPKVTPQSFTFDRVFAPSDGQGEVFMEVQSFVQSALDGFSVCLFSYGQTEKGGVLYHGPWNRLVRISSSKRGVVGVIASESVIWRYTWNRFEIYWLNQALTNSNGVAEVTNLVTVTLDPNDTDEVFSITHVYLTGSLDLVDLAGSERLDKSNATGARQLETRSINTSLSHLTVVFNAIAAKQSGDGKTMMMINLSPAKSNATESLNTLRFALGVSQLELGRAKKAISTIKINNNNGNYNNNTPASKAMTTTTAAITPFNCRGNDTLDEGDDDDNNDLMSVVSDISDENNNNENNNGNDDNISVAQSVNSVSNSVVSVLTANMSVVTGLSRQDEPRRRVSRPNTVTVAMPPSSLRTKTSNNNINNNNNNNNSSSTNNINKFMVRTRSTTTMTGGNGMTGGGGGGGPSPRASQGTIGGFGTKGRLGGGDMISMYSIIICVRLCCNKGEAQGNRGS
eukprot:gene6515-13155_t